MQIICVLIDMCELQRRICISQIRLFCENFENE